MLLILTKTDILFTEPSLKLRLTSLHSLRYSFFCLFIFLLSCALYLFFDALFVAVRLGLYQKKVQGLF